jgi:hypothetical protein
MHKRLVARQLDHHAKTTGNATPKIARRTILGFSVLMILLLPQGSSHSVSPDTYIFAVSFINPAWSLRLASFQKALSIRLAPSRPIAPE